MLIEREKLNSLLKGDIKLFTKKYENAYVKMKKEGEIFKIFQLRSCSSQTVLAFDWLL